MPALEALLPRFHSAHTQPLGVSVDSVFSHANWARDVGGVSFPLLADFHPKGAMAESFGVYLADKGITDRATIVIDADGVVRHASSVTPAGRRDMNELLALCEEVDREYSGSLPDAPAKRVVPSDAKLYVKSACGFSRAVLLARDNLHLDAIPVVNLTEDAGARGELEKLAGKDQAPALCSSDGVVQESADIIARMVQAAAPICVV